MLKTATPTLAAACEWCFCCGVFVLFGYKHEAQKHYALNRNVHCFGALTCYGFRCRVTH